MYNLPQNHWKNKIQKELKHLEKKLLLRELRPHLGRIDFSSNDYLSVNANGTLQKIFENEFKKKKTNFVGSTGSRLLSGHYESFTKLETDLARYVGVQSSLFFSSGYAANVGVLPAILGIHDVAFCDRLCHASLLDGVRLSQARRFYFKHNDLNELERKLQYHSEKRKSRSFFWIIVESIYSMDGDSPNLRLLCDLAERYDACIYLDEAHAFGIRGEGCGLACEQGVLSRITISVFPCGKALGLMGAFVCGPEELRILLMNKARSFMYSTAPLPILASLLASVLEIVFSKKMASPRQNIITLSKYFLSELGKRTKYKTPSTSHILPVLTTSSNKALILEKGCQSAGFDVRAIRPPTVANGASRLRFILQAMHVKKDVDRVLSVLERL